MKHTSLYVLFFLASIFTNFSAQDLTIASNGSMFVSPGNYLYVGGNLSVAASGELEILSNSASSASLLLKSTSTSMGNITYKRSLKDTEFYVVSSPVDGQSINSFVTNAANDIKTKALNYALGVYKNGNTSTTKWEYYNTGNVATAGDFAVAKGYSVSRNSVGSIEFTGTLNTSDTGVPITISNGANGSWNAIGNPYPTFLPANDNAAVSNFLNTNTSSFDPLFIGMYVWNGTAYTLINHSSASTFLHPGQGFLVKAKSDGNQVITFTEALQSHQTTSTTYLKSKGIPTLNLHITSDDDTKSTEIKYLETATLGLDPGYDGGSYSSGGAVNLSLDTHLVSNSSGVNLAIQCLPLTAFNNVAVPLSITAKANKELNFTLDKTNFTEDLFVFIEDKEKNTVNELTSNYKTTIDKDIESIGRFYLHTSTKSTLSTTDLNTASSFNFYENNRTIYSSGIEANDVVKLKIFNILGKEEFNTVLKNKTQYKTAIPKYLKSGIYLLYVSSNKGTKVKKIIL